jgi:hypothetical protein
MTKLWMSALALAALATAAAGQSTNNNGARVGKEGYLLNVIAFDRCPRGDFAGSNRRTIAVQADYTGVSTDAESYVNKIFVQSGSDVRVQDGNACDANGAQLQLPVDAANCRNCASSTPPAPTFRQYEVRARVVGKPGGTVRITGCVGMQQLDPATQEETSASLCSVGQNDIWVGAGREWENVSRQLLTVCIDTTGDGVCDERVGLFDSRGKDYWWSLDHAGRPHVQLVLFAAPRPTGGGGA